jgi:glycopeptide antibiotics resistance protein
MRWLDSFWQHQQRQDKLNRLLNAYLLVLFVFNVLPLDLTFNPVELFHKWSDGRVFLMPFAGLKGGWSGAVYQTLTDILVWVPAGLLWALRPGSNVKGVVLHGLLAGAVIEALQLFVYTRVTDVTDILMAGVGAWVGWLVAKRTAVALPRIDRLLERRWLAVWLIWAVMTLGVFWFPFNFVLPGLNTAAAVDAFTRLPFTTYYFGTEYHAINELLRKMGFFLPGGLWLGLAVCRASGPTRRTAWVLIGLLAISVEVGQLALPGKTSVLTDVFLEFGGGVLGYVMAVWIGSAAAATPPFECVKNPLTEVDAVLPVTRALAPWAVGYQGHLAYVAVLSLVIGAAFRLPMVPYNVRELLMPGLGGVVSVLGLALTVYCMANCPFLFFATRRRRWLHTFPLGLVAQGLLAWCLLRIAVPIESLEDIVGSPVLGWSWDWEMMGRYIALNMAVMLQVMGAALCVRAIVKPEALADFFYWALISALLAWPLHLVVVQWAATDNLTELMAWDASFLASLVLATGLFLTFLAASALSAAVSAVRAHRVLLGLVLPALAGAAACYWVGAEQTIVKYGRVFSAFQFLLSTDRAHYAQGAELMMRFGVAMLTLCGGLAALQYLSWRWLVSMSQKLARGF